MLLLAAGSLAILSPTHAQPPEQAAAHPTTAAVNSDHGIAVKGYDVVAYFTDAKPTRGKPEYAFKWHDATWQFTSAEHRAAFQREPEKYAPQYGGYCAFGVCHNALSDIDPNQWKIVDGKLYLNANVLAGSLFKQDPEGHIKKADQNWPTTSQHSL